MSGDTAAFLAGCAVTGVAALLLAKGDFANGQPGSLQPIQSVIPSLATPAPTASAPSDRLEDVQRGWQVQTKLEQQQDVARELSDQLKNQQGLADDLKNQVAKQQSESEDLKSQLDKQQRNTEMLIAQLQEQQRVIDKVVATSQARPLELSTRPSEDNGGNVQTLVLAIGAVILVVIIVGTIVLVGVVLLVAMSRRRQPRTVHVMQQPMPQSYAFPEQHLLPQRSNRVKAPKQIDVDYYAD